MAMLISGLLVVAESDNVYMVRDQYRVLGGVVRHYVPTENYPAVRRAFRAFGQDFETLSGAVEEFLKIRGCKPRNAMGDLIR
jgi:hypothetical protein